MTDRISKKSAVYEHCTKYKINIPNAIIWQVSGSSHQPEWTGSLKLDDHTNINYTGSTKRLVEEKIYNDVLVFLLSQADSQNIGINGENKEFITKNDQVTPSCTNENKSITILIDADNVKIPEDFIKKFMSNCEFHFFTAKNSPFAHSSTMKQLQECFLHVSGTVVKDAADHLLSFKCGEMFAKFGNSKTYIVVTKDHFGEAVANFVAGHHVCNIKHLCSLIKKVQSH